MGRPRIPRAVVVKDGLPICPSRRCGGLLTDPGSVWWPCPNFADLYVEDGKVRVGGIVAGDAEVKRAQCSACGQPLDLQGAL